MLAAVPPRARLAAAFVLLGAVLLLASAAALWSFGAARDPSSIRVNVRWTDAGITDRANLERRLGLSEPRHLEGRTWGYRPTDRSRAAIERLVRAPQVEDTARIDRETFEVVVEDLPPLVSVLIVHEVWQPAAIALFVAGVALPLAVRRAVGELARAVGSAVSRHRHASLLGLVGILSVSSLMMRISGRPEDSTFVHLYEVPSILAGDHPYRDFFEWGAPLPAYLSAGAQLMVGHRVIGEVILQDTFIVMGVLVAFALGLRVARSVAAVVAVLPVALFVLLVTPPYHYSKLFCFPVGLWLSWHYMERPGATRAAGLGCFVGVAFLFRHDYVLWVGFAAATAILLPLLTSAPRRRLRHVLQDSLVGSLASVVVITPLVLAVSSGEGLTAYAQARLGQYEASSLEVPRQNPFAIFLPKTLPPPRSGEVTFAWADNIDDASKTRLLGTYGISARAPGSDGRARYVVRNIYDARLLEFRRYLQSEAGFPWDVLELKHTRSEAQAWLIQIALLVAAALLWGGVRRWWKAQSTQNRARASWMLHGGLFLTLTDLALFQESGYVVTTAPLTAALGAVFLVRDDENVEQSHRGSTLRSRLHQTAALALLFLATHVSLIPLGGLRGVASELPFLYEQAPSRIEDLVASPPRASDEEDYLRRCSSPGDRLLVTGMTPFYYTYITNRPIAGGHVYWHSKLHASPERQARSLALLQRQSVPFAVSSSDPVMADFSRAYPMIAEHLQRNYEEVPGTAGRILFDTRRAPLTWYGKERWPCFSAENPAPR